MCSLRDCSVCECEEGEVPRPWTDAETHPPPAVPCESTGTPGRVHPAPPQTLPELHLAPSVPCGSAGPPGRVPSRVPSAPETLREPLPTTPPGSPTDLAPGARERVGPPTPSYQGHPSAVTHLPNSYSSAGNPIPGGQSSKRVSLPEDASERSHPPFPSPDSRTSEGVLQPPSLTSGHVRSPAPSPWVSLEAQNIAGDARNSSVTGGSMLNATGWALSCNWGLPTSMRMPMSVEYIFLWVLD